MTTPPTEARKIIINNLMTVLVSSGFYALQDIGYLLAAADSQAARLNWINPATFTLTPVNAPVFTANQGYTGDGLSTGLDSGMAANAGVNWQQTSASFTWIVPGANSQDSGAEIGSSTVTNASGVARSTSDLSTCRIGSSNALAVAATNSNGIRTLTRSGTTLTNYLNGVSQGSGTITNSAFTSATLQLLRSSVFTSRLVSGGFFGGLVTPDQIVAVHAALKTYCNALNPGAIT